MTDLVFYHKKTIGPLTKPVLPNPGQLNLGLLTPSESYAKLEIKTGLNMPLSRALGSTDSSEILSPATAYKTRKE